MALDVALGVLLLVGAIRGWFRGFMSPAIRLAALVGAAYAAAPVRVWARPHVAPYLQTISPDLLDRMLWWTSAAAVYLGVIGAAGLASAIGKRQTTFGEPESNHANQFAGMLLGMVKTTVVLVFLVAGLDRYARDWARTIPWADQQARTSRALAWTRQYQPAAQIWDAPPVRQFVAHVHRMGIESRGPAAEDRPDPISDPSPPDTTTPPVQTANSRPPRLSLPDPDHTPRPDPSADDFLHAFDKALERAERTSPR